MQREAEQPLPAWAAPEALGFIALGIGIFSAAPFLCGWVHPMSAIATAPWGIAAFIVFIIVTIILFRNRNLMAGTAFGVLGVLLSGAIALKAVQGLMMLLNNVTAPPPLAAGGLITDAMVWVAFGIVLIPIGYLSGYQSKPFAMFIWLADIGVWMLAAADFGVAGHAVGIVGGYFIFILGIWFLHLGIGEMVNGTLRRKVVPLGRPLFKRPAPPQA
jgi:hypothetical protein